MYSIYVVCKFKSLYIQSVFISNPFNGVCYKLVNAILQFALLEICMVICLEIMLFYFTILGFPFMWYTVGTCICNF